MRILVFLTALMMTTPAAASDLSNGRRYVLLLLAILDNGSVQSIPFQNNTFTTEASCERAGQKIVQHLARSGARVQIAYSCLDRGSAV